MWNKRFLAFWKYILALLIFAIVVYYFRFAPVKVESSVAEIGSIIAEVMGTGTLEARIHATISPKISGRITEVLVDQGDNVTKGQVLVRLDAEDLRQQIEIAKAELAATKASLKKAIAQIKSAEATVKEANSTFTRMSQLVDSGAISLDEFEKAQQRMDVANAELNRSESAQIEAEELVAKAEASLRYYQERLADTTVTAPFDGLIIRRYRNPGDIAVPGNMILDIISFKEIWVSAWVDESTMNSLEIGQPARIVFRSAPNKSYKGTVARIAPLADRETREFLVDVTIKELPEKWAIGQRAEVYIQTATKENALLVPSTAIIW